MAPVNASAVALICMAVLGVAAIAISVSVSTLSSSPPSNDDNGSEFPERDALRDQIADKLNLVFIETIPNTTEVGLFLVDFQNAFVKPGEPLAVPGATTDALNVKNFVDNNVGRILKFWASFDSHPDYYVGSTKFLKDAVSGDPAPIFVDIDPEFILNGTFIAQNSAHQPYADAYATCLQAQNLSWNVWPDHGIFGTESWAFFKDIEESATLFVEYWFDKIPFNSEAGPAVILKAQSPWTDQFGWPIAPCPNTDPSTQLQEAYVNETKAWTEAGNYIIFAGEALSFCVRNGIFPLIDQGVAAEKLILAYDSASPIPAFADLAEETIAKAQSLGVRFTLLESLVVEGEFRTSGPGQLTNHHYTLPPI